MKRIQDMIESAQTKIEAINTLIIWMTFGSITKEQYNEGIELTNQKFID